ncbi:NAD(P)-binding domain-containing protein [Nisaea sediminum]|uniref:NAD(P)-binding domain-containing protein n=1 Tax=Nisaea sediminum TaxID=2775867 RepID=UPI0018695426|nr:NAD(P)-binding domain-containing protein [Nisaea sediminum]
MYGNLASAIAIIGAGPVGLAAAARLLERGMTPLIFERGASAGASISEWSHVRVFSPWRFNVDSAASALLKQNGWREPDGDYLPTGGELIRDYLAPLAAHPGIAPHLHLGAEVVSISRQGRSKLVTEGRDESSFVIVWRDRDGQQHRAYARAVIDASGTWQQPNPIGLDGLPVEGEQENAALIAYGIPDVKGRSRAVYEGKHTLVVGAGHSAINTALDLIDLQDEAPDTRITWATRSGGIERLLGGGLNDALPGRGMLGMRAAEAIRSGRVDLKSPLALQSLRNLSGRLSVFALQASEELSFEVDRIVVATGFRPALSMLRELRVSLDPAVEAPPALSPLIDPNLHSCGTVRPHGVVELSHPEKDFFIVGSKSYGRAPTFLMTTGYEQVRSIAAELAGDHAAAREVHLELPETGVCRSAPVEGAVGRLTPEGSACCGAEAPAASEPGCCGGAPVRNLDACCAKDEEAKAFGETGCGCNASHSTPERAPA